MDLEKHAIRQLADKQELLELVTLYCRAIDRRDFPLLRSLYHPGARECRGAIYEGDAGGFVDWAAGDAVNYELTVHRLFNSYFVIDGDFAEGEIYAEAYHRTAGADPQEVIAGGRYLDRYQRCDGRWGFIYRTSTIDRCEMRPLNQDAYRQFVAGSPGGIAGSEDLSYQVFSLQSPMLRHAGG